MSSRQVSDAYSFPAPSSPFTPTSPASQVSSQSRRGSEVHTPSPSRLVSRRHVPRSSLARDLTNESGRSWEEEYTDEKGVDAATDMGEAEETDEAEETEDTQDTQDGETEDGADGASSV